MDQSIKRQLDAANKFIFVKRYEEAERILDALVSTSDGRKELLVQLRRIELATMLKKLDRLRKEFISAISKDERDRESEICLSLVEQHGEMVASAQSISTYQEIIRKHGPHAAAYFGIAYSMEVQGNLDRAVYNYEQSIAADPDWYPSYFGLSQVFYHKGDEKLGDHYFYLFEQAAPYNVYGNFETHRNLAQAFSEEGRPIEAEAAVTALSEWWHENRGHTPVEIQIYEHLAIAKIHRNQGDTTRSESRRMRGRVAASQALEHRDTKEGTLYFIARVLEEYGEVELAFDYYKKILRREGSNPALVQKIGSQFLASGDYALAGELFHEAYKVHPDNSEIRFCFLVSKLKQAQVNVEEYLIGRERLRQLVESGDRVELLALLHSLLAKFQEDPDVHGHIADIYLRLGNIDRAAKHYREMQRLDGRCRKTALKFAAFLMQYDDPEAATRVLDEINQDQIGREDQAEIYWLKANYHARRKDYQESLKLLRKVLAIDPWNISYLVQQIIDLTCLKRGQEVESRLEGFLHDINGSDEAHIDWEEYDRNTMIWDNEHAYELVYVRSKLRFLYANGEDDTLLKLIRAAATFDAAHGTFDLMRLLNTNFDGPKIYWALGILFKDLWQLETSSMWLEQVLMFPDLDNGLKAKALLELADCYIWQNRSLSKAIEYVKLSMDIGARDGTSKAFTTLAHAYLRSGKVREAKIYLEQAEGDVDAEARYLRGLVLYRNGSRKEANREWKPLLTVRTENLRFHNIKQEILKYYFDGEPYLKVN